jgi:hypothetical protein
MIRLRRGLRSCIAQLNINSGLPVMLSVSETSQKWMFSIIMRSFANAQDDMYFASALRLRFATGQAG